MKHWLSPNVLKRVCLSRHFASAPPFDPLRAHLTTPSPGHLYTARTTLDSHKYPSLFLRYDESQAQALKPLNSLHRRLETYGRERMNHENQVRERVLRVNETIANLEKEKSDTEKSNTTYNKSINFAKGFDHLSSVRVPRGLYLHGTVGTGKSLCMDLLYEASTLPKKRRVHFHDFMSETHQRVHEWKMKQPTIDIGHRRKDGSRYVRIAPESDALVHVASEISKEAWLLCFDEFQVTDVADALIMTKLFGTMWKNGTVVVATSNRAPSTLYENGLNRHYFMPFIGALETQCKLHDMDSKLDHRMLTRKDSSDRSGYIIIDSTNPKDSEMELNQIFTKAAQEQEEEEEEEEEVQNQKEETKQTITVPTAFGRTLNVPFDDCHGGVVRFQFDQLCSKDLGAADYRSLAQRFHTIAVYNIPKMDRRMHNEARRFIMFIDQLYERRTRLLCTAATGPMDLFNDINEENVFSYDDEVGRDVVSNKVRVEELASVQELGFAYQRAASRLVEMGSIEYGDKHNENKI